MGLLDALKPCWHFWEYEKTERNDLTGIVSEIYRCNKCGVIWKRHSFEAGVDYRRDRDGKGKR